MNLKQIIKQEVGNDKYPTLKRIKAGRIIAVVAALPLCSAWMFAFAIPMMMPMSFSMWAKDKIRNFKEGRKLRWKQN